MSETVYGKVAKVQLGTRPFALKRYDQADTAAFKCWGSGHQNELIVHRVLGSLVPQALAQWSDQVADYTLLEWVEGSPWPAKPRPTDWVNVGRLLGRIHSQTSEHFGALDGLLKFPSQKEAFRSRFQSALRLLARKHAMLSEQVAKWSDARLVMLKLDRGPRLVHGDFGPDNLIIREDAICVIDWEHARWGNPQEDWAKLRFAERFPEPNGFAAGTTGLRHVQAGWIVEMDCEPPNDEIFEQLLEVYYAMCLGTFFDTEANDRLALVRSIVG